MPRYRMLKEVRGEKPGSHLLRIPGQPKKEINAGDEVTCEAEYLKNVMWKFELVEEPLKEEPPVVKLLVKKCDGGYNLINPESGNPINSKPLKKADAEAMIEMSVAQAEELLKEPGEPPTTN